MVAFFERIKTGIPSVRNRPLPSKQAVGLPQSRSTVRANSPYASVTVEALVKEVGPLSPGCVLVGACEDRVHFYMDLYDPHPGSVLIASESRSGSARLLQAILSSAVLLNSYRRLRFTWLSAKASGPPGLLRQPHCYGTISAASQEAGQAITRLADVAERRLEQGSADSLLILAVDGLEGFYSKLDDQAYDDLVWLIRNGPTLRIWPFITLDAAWANRVGAGLIDLFGTRLLGRMDAGQTQVFKGDPAITGRLVEEKQFCVWYDDTWLSFWAAEPAVLNQLSK
jgi:hypothetical protein